MERKIFQSYFSYSIQIGLIDSRSKIPLLDMSNVNLNDIDFGEHEKILNLKYIHLAKIQSVNGHFHKLVLDYVIFSGSILRNVNFSYSHIYKVKMIDCSLQNSTFIYASVEGVSIL